jgi:hypothetical protein
MGALNIGNGCAEQHADISCLVGSLVGGVQVPHSAAVLDFVFSDTDQTSWDNANYRDYHTLVEGVLYSFSCRTCDLIFFLFFLSGSLRFVHSRHHCILGVCLGGRGLWSAALSV